MPENKTPRQSLADRIAAQGGGLRGWWRQTPIGSLMRGDVGEAFRGTPIGQLATGGGISGAWHATPLGGLIDAMRARTQQGPRATPVGAFGPTAGDYSGLPAGPSQAPAQVQTWGATDWSQFIPPDANMGPPEISPPTRGQPAGPRGGRDPSRAAFGAAPSGLAGILGGGSMATGANLLGMMAANPVRQSGIQFVDQEQER